MSSSSSSSAVSLDPTDTALCTPLLLETKSDAEAAAITTFFKLPTRILIGTKRLSFPISPAHMLYNCALWQKAVEGGDEPKALLTETCVEPTDVEFQRAWLKANGFDDGKGPLGESGERYLDYLGYKTKSACDRGIRRAISRLAEYTDVCNGTADAIAAIEAYTAFVAVHGNRVFEYDQRCCEAACRILQSEGFSVNFNMGKIQLMWVPPERNAATKRSRPE